MIWAANGVLLLLLFKWVAADQHGTGRKKPLTDRPIWSGNNNRQLNYTPNRQQPGYSQHNNIWGKNETKTLLAAQHRLTTPLHTSWTTHIQGLGSPSLYLQRVA